METLNEFKTKYENKSPDELIMALYEMSIRVHELQRLTFGRKSEKQRYDTSCMQSLFNEFEVISQLNPEEPDDDSDVIEENDNTSKKPPKKSKGKQARKISPNVPRKTIIIDLTDEQKICQKHNTALTKVGEHKTEKVVYVPASILINEEITYSYKCTCCEKESEKTEFVSSVREPDLLPGSVATPSLLAHIAVSKFDDGLPLYRQEEILNRLGLHIHRSTMARWMVKAGNSTVGLLNLMKSDCLEMPAIHIDETHVQVLKEKDRPATSTSYMWCMGSQVGSKMIIFEYHQGRNKKAATSMLDGYTGYVTADGYGVYDSLAKSDNTNINQNVLEVLNLSHDEAEAKFKLAGCMVHCRRKFDSALKQASKEKSKAPIAAQAKKMIDQLYVIETQIKKRTPEEKFKIRQEKAIPLLDKFKQWLEQVQTQITPSSLTGKAISYTLNQWDKLIRYCESGYVDIDNNFIERAIRQFVIGRNNWVFISSPEGADATANLYSLVETAKLNGLCPNSYLTKIFKELPMCKTQEDLEKLLPYNIAKYHSIEQYKKAH